MTRRFRSGLVVVINVAVVSCSATSDQNRDPMNEAAEATPFYEPLVVAAESHDLTKDDIDQLMDELSNWGRWGPNDQLGSANLITPAKRLEAVSLVTEGITPCHSNISCS